MSEQENNKMEAWLKAYRQQRRDQWNEDPVELDEPTRAMLMAEVRRQHPAAPVATSEAAAASESSLGWLRWALGGMTAAIVALGVSSISKFQSGPDTVALGNPDAGEASRSEQANQNLAKATADQAKRDVNAKAEAVAEAEAGAPGMAAKGSTPGSPGMAATVQAHPSIQPAPHPSAPGIARNMPTRQNVQMANGNYYNSAREMQLNFAQQARPRSAAAMRMAKQKDLPKPVLVNFELKRVGNTIRVVDGDGSVYTGAVINEETLPTNPGEAEERPEVAVAQPSVGGEGGGAGPSRPKAGVLAVKSRRGGNQAFFRVQGTNKTLKQLVILEATLDNSTVAPAAFGGAGAAQVAGKPAQLGQPGQPGGVVPPLAPKKPEPEGEDKLNKSNEADQKNRNPSAIRAIARMRVLGNARIGKENFPVDAYLDTRGNSKVPADKALEKPAGVKK